MKRNRKWPENARKKKPPDYDRMLVLYAMAQFALDLYTTFGR